LIIGSYPAEVSDRHSAVNPLDAVYWDPTGAAIGFVLIGLITMAIIAGMRWNMSTNKADVFVVERSIALDRIRAASAHPVRAKVRWQKPEWDSEWWMPAQVCPVGDELVIVPDHFASIQIASAGRPWFRAYIVPGARVTTVRWIPNEIWPAWRSGLTSQLIEVSTDADATCYLGSARAKDLDDLVEALRPR
jgi:hypothetical protein